MALTSLACSVLAASLGLIGGIVPVDMAAAQVNDPLACAKAVDGTPVRIGAPVHDAEGVQIGSVSLSQCSVDVEEGKLRVFLSSELGGEVKVVDLAGARATLNAVYLAATAKEIAGLPLPNALAQARERPGS